MVRISQDKRLPQGDSVNNYRLGLADYLKKCPYRQECQLSSNGMLSFHWADWKETCDIQKLLLKINGHALDRRKNLEESLNVMKSYPAWINNGDRTKKMSLYDIYQAYLDPKLRALFFENEKKKLLLGLNGQKGPYYPMNNLNWYDEDIFLSFLYDKILSNRGTLRDFRLRMKFPAEVQVDRLMKAPIKIRLAQITKFGLLFKGPTRLQLQLQTLKAMKRDFSLSLNLEFFDSLISGGNYTLVSKFESLPADIVNLIGRSDKLIVNAEEIRIEDDKIGTDRFHFFIPFSALNSHKSMLDPQSILKQFIDSTESKFEREMKEVLAQVA